MDDVFEKPKQRKPVRRQRSIYQVHYSLPPQRETVPRPYAMFDGPPEVHAYMQQVAGHTGTDETTKYIGLLQCSDGTILKPILKECQWREVEFYERVQTEPALAELREHVPAYRGTRKHAHGGTEMDYIVLEDLTRGMLEPCIMDVKIGKRTWDPLANEEKIRREDSKYAECKRQYGFCIPGYQVYRLEGGRRLRYGKDHGKGLRGEKVIDAIRNYLNASGEGAACRSLLLQLLAALWRLQRWATRARPLRLYSTSLLLAYDAARLRACCAAPHGTTPKCGPPASGRRKSLPALAGSNFSGQVSAQGPVYRKVNSVPACPPAPPAPPPPAAWGAALDRLALLHSFDHNYEEKLSTARSDYRALLGQLSGDGAHSHAWASAKLIDFAHAFFDQPVAVDDNFKEGIDNFVAILESLLESERV